MHKYIISFRVPEMVRYEVEIEAETISEAKKTLIKQAIAGGVDAWKEAVLEETGIPEQISVDWIDGVRNNLKVLKK